MMKNIMETYNKMMKLVFDWVAIPIFMRIFLPVARIVGLAVACSFVVAQAVAPDPYPTYLSWVGRGILILALIFVISVEIPAGNDLFAGTVGGPTPVWAESCATEDRIVVCDLGIGVSCHGIVTFLALLWGLDASVVALIGSWHLVLGLNGFLNPVAREVFGGEIWAKVHTMCFVPLLFGWLLWGAPDTVFMERAATGLLTSEGAVVATAHMRVAMAVNTVFMCGVGYIQHILGGPPITPKSTAKGMSLMVGCMSGSWGVATAVAFYYGMGLALAVSLLIYHTAKAATLAVNQSPAAVIHAVLSVGLGYCYFVEGPTALDA